MMTVRDRTWTRRGSGLTRPGNGSLVVARYGLMDVFGSRVFLAFYVLCLMPSILALIAIYLSHSTALLEQVPAIQEWAAKVPIWIFRWLFTGQIWPAFLVAVIAAPPLIAVDLAHNAITLILSRPITRPEYILGKLLVLVVVLSPLTWIPAIACYALQGMLEGNPWLANNLRIALAYFVSHWVWILVISLFGLAVSSRVRYATVSRGVILAVILVGSTTGWMLNQLTRTSIGDLFSLRTAIDSVFLTLLGVPSTSGLWVVFNWMSLLLLAAVSMWILNRRIRACEEVA